MFALLFLARNDCIFSVNGVLSYYEVSTPNTAEFNVARLLPRKEAKT